MLLDVRLPDGSGLDVCRQVLAAAPETRCLMLTPYAVKNYVSAVLAKLGLQGRTQAARDRLKLMACGF